MKLLILSLYFLAFLPCVFVSHADPVPAFTVSMLQKREDATKQLDFVWKQQEIFQSQGLKPETISRLQKQADTVPSKLLREHRISQSEASRWDNDEKQQVSGLANNSSSTSYSTWTFQRFGGQTLVTGSREVMPGTTATSTQYYSGANALLVYGPSQSNDGKNAAPPDPVEWSSSGEAIRFRSPFQDGLDLFPEHFVLLASFNPLSMYGEKWSLVSQSPAFWQIKAHITRGSFAPFTVLINLSRGHDGLPSTVKIKSDNLPWSATMNVEGYKRYKGEWLCSQMNFTFDAPGILHRQQKWTLQSISESKPITVSVPHDRFVHDYRLIGKDLTTNNVLDAETKDRRNVALYHWLGQFPTLDDLKKMHQKQHPGEALPDPGQSSAVSPGLSTPAARANLIGSVLPFAGGLMCVVGGVWMFQHRRAK